MTISGFFIKYVREKYEDRIIRVANVFSALAAELRYLEFRITRSETCTSVVHYRGEQ